MEENCYIRECIYIYVISQGCSTSAKGRSSESWALAIAACKGAEFLEPWGTNGLGFLVIKYVRRIYILFLFW